MNLEILKLMWLARILSDRRRRTLAYRAYDSQLHYTNFKLHYVFSLLNAKSCMILFEAQLRLDVEYALLTWVSNLPHLPASLISWMSKPQHIVSRYGSVPGIMCQLQPLQHRWKVAEVMVLSRATFAQHSMALSWWTVRRKKLWETVYLLGFIPGPPSFRDPSYLA